MPHHPDLETVLLTREQIAARVAELGRQISDDYRGGNLILVGVLKGSVVFLADLMRAITIPHRFDLVRASSYGSEATSSGQVAIANHLALPLADCDVLIVEDILDTGQTLGVLQQQLESLGARRVDVCVFLDKQRDKLAHVSPRYVGFAVPDRFVVGYGLDYDERYRHLDCVAVLKPSVYEPTMTDEG